MLGEKPLTAAGLVTLHRQGMAAWIKAAPALSDLSPFAPAYRPSPLADGPARSELTLILANLVVTLATERAYA